jgi:hypothetical protein
MEGQQESQEEKSGDRATAQEHAQKVLVGPQKPPSYMPQSELSSSQQTTLK